MAQSVGATIPADVLMGEVGLLALALGGVGAVGHLLLIVAVRVTGAVFPSQSSYTATPEARLGRCCFWART